MTVTTQSIKWLRALAAKGGKGVVNNIDARCLGRIADKLDSMQCALEEVIFHDPSSPAAAVARQVLGVQDVPEERALEPLATELRR